MFGAARERHRSHQIPPQRQKKCSEKKGRSKNMNTILLPPAVNPLPITRAARVTAGAPAPAQTNHPSAPAPAKTNHPNRLRHGRRSGAS